MTTIDLLIRLRRQSGDTYAIEMQRRERGRTPVEPLARVRPRPSLTIDWTRPLMLGTDPTAYGRWLGELLFGDLACHAGLREALNAAGPDGTLRLRLDLDDPLQELAWETLALRDLGTLATSQRVLFSRYLESDRGYVPLPHTSPRAVVAVADPPDIDQYGLARPTAERYRNTARAQLADFALDEVQATMAALRQALQQPADLLYLVAHGALKDGAPWLFLEDEHGHAARVPGAEVARDMLNLPAPPRLAVLVSCHSGGSGPQTAAGPGAGGHDPLAALGPRLVRAGVPAVIDDKLMQCLRMRIVDRQVLKLIRMWLQTPVIERDDEGRTKGTSPKQGTPQGGVISPLLANVYLHWFEKAFHAPDGPATWAKARIVRYADDFVILARYQGRQLIDWMEKQLEGRFQLTINREKTSVVNLNEPGASLDFLGFTFRYDRDLHGGSQRYLNVFPSKKSQARARDKLRELTSSRRCFMPITKMVGETNGWLHSWANYFRHGYPRVAFRNINRFARERLIRHLNRRSQRPFRLPKGTTYYAQLQALGLRNL